MEHLSGEIRQAIDAGLYSVALYAALALPDNCATMDPKTYDPQSNAQTYKNWFEQNLKSDMDYLTADDLWRLRSRTLHNGQLQVTKYRGIIFTLPTPQNIFVHNNSFESERSYFNIDLRTFCDTIIDAVDAWWEENRHNPELTLKPDQLVRYRPDGFPGFIGGIPVIA